MDSIVVLFQHVFDGLGKVCANGGKMSKTSKLESLHNAIEFNHMSDLSTLVQGDVNVNAVFRQETAFTRALDIRHYKAADMIMKSKSFDPNAPNQFDRTPLFVAAKTGQTQFVEKLLEMGAAVNTPDVRGVSPLGACGWYDHYEPAKVLLKHGADVNQADVMGETPLYRACSNVCTNLVKVLIEYKCDVNQANKDMRTPLMAALPSWYNTQFSDKKISTSLSICQMLIQAGCDLNAQDIGGKTALHHAVENDDIYSVCTLAENGCKLDTLAQNGFTPFTRSISPTGPRYEIARYLLYYGADPNQALPTQFSNNDSKSPISHLLSEPVATQTQANKWSKAMLLLTLRGAVYPNKADVPPDCRRAESDKDDLPFPEEVDRQILEWLQSDVPSSLQHQARLSVRNSLGRENVIPRLNTLPIGTALKQYLSLGLRPENMPLSKLCELHLSIEDGLNDKVREIVTGGMNVNVYIKNKTPLGLALEVGNLEAAKIILKSQPKIQTKMMNSSLESALHIVAREGQMAVLEEILSLSADIDAKDFDGRTPLHRAVKKGHFDVAKVLVQKGADVSSPKDDPTPLIHLAAAYGDADFIKVLLDKGVDPNSVDDYGNTPLHVAATRGVEYLRRFVALPGLYNDPIAANLDTIRFVLRDEDPRYIKSITGHPEVIECLLKHGADPKKVDEQNETALQRARRGENADVIRALEGRQKTPEES